MAGTVRENILANIKTTLEAVTVANGYSNTIASVQRWDQAGKVSAVMPFITISEGEEQKNPTPHPMYTCNLPVFIEVETIKDETNTDPMSVVLNSLLGDVETALMADRTRGGYAKNTTLRSNSQFNAVEGQPTAGIIIEIEIVYQHRQDDPEAKT